MHRSNKDAGNAPSLPYMNCRFVHIDDDTVECLTRVNLSSPHWRRCESLSQRWGTISEIDSYPVKSLNPESPSCYCCMSSMFVLRAERLLTSTWCGSISESGSDSVVLVALPTSRL